MAKTTAAEAKAYRLRTIYKQTPEDRENLLKDQDHQCVICGRKFMPVGTFVPFQDHDHKCCPVRKQRYCGLCNRGLLCFICNKKVVGALEKIAKLGIDVIRAMSYISHWNMILTEKGAYAEKPKKAKRVRKAKKSV